MSAISENAAAGYSLCAFSLCGSGWGLVLKTNTAENVQKTQDSWVLLLQIFFFSSTIFCIVDVLFTSRSILFDRSWLSLFMLLFLLYWGEEHPPGLEFKGYVASFGADTQTQSSSAICTHWLLWFHCTHSGLLRLAVSSSLNSSRMGWSKCPLTNVSLL